MSWTPPPELSDFLWDALMESTEGTPFCPSDVLGVSRDRDLCEVRRRAIIRVATGASYQFRRGYPPQAWLFDVEPRIGYVPIGEIHLARLFCRDRASIRHILRSHKCNAPTAKPN